MELKNLFEDQMATRLWFFRFPQPLIVLLLIPFGLILGFGFFSVLLTYIALVFSTLIFKSSKKNPVLLEKLVEEKVAYKSEMNESASTTQKRKEVEEAESVIHEAPSYSVASPDLVSESECHDHLSTSEEDSEVLDWPFGDNVDRSPDFSDGSISDEDSLIEISLSGGYYVGREKEAEDCLFNLHQKMSGLSHKAIFQQHTLCKFLNQEMQEEENMIEIDLSMGSIKCSRFEIEA